MFSLNTKKQVATILAVLLLASIACRVEMPRIVFEESPTPIQIPTEVITQVITEIVTPTPLPVSPTPEPSLTPEPSVSPTFDPLAAPIYYPLPNCVASRLRIGDQAMVSHVGGPNGIRYGLDLQYDTVVYWAQPGEFLTILDGPWCSHGWIVWFVETLSGLKGYTPEGNGESYWLLPVK